MEGVSNVYDNISPFTSTAQKFGIFKATPVVNKVFDALSIVNDIHNGNYGQAGVKAVKAISWPHSTAIDIGVGLFNNKTIQRQLAQDEQVQVNRYTKMYRDLLQHDDPHSDLDSYTEKIKYREGKRNECMRNAGMQIQKTQIQPFYNQGYH